MTLHAPPHSSKRQRQMSDLAGGFDLNVRLEEDDNNNAAFDLNQPIDDNSNAAFHFLIRLQCLYHFN